MDTMKKILSLGLLLWLAALVGCASLPFGFTKISEITAAPASFEGKEIKIKGKVKSLTKITLLDISMFTLDDGTGEILVIPSGAPPAEQETVAISGKVESVAIIGGRSMGIHFKEIKRLPSF
jgi:hypothetical protein